MRDELAAAEVTRRVSPWRRRDAAAYLHQWQFPLSKTAVPKLCFRCDPLPCLDEDLLKHWLDICLGDNPLQYLFMGEASTSSKLHIDPGGLDLLIAPIIGEIKCRSGLDEDLGDDDFADLVCRNDMYES